MRSRISRFALLSASVVTFAAIASVSGARSAQAAAGALAANQIGGVVNGPGGPEAGVWVIAETRNLPTRYVKIVVTDDKGRYLIPELPKANYDVWVRGYGLVDSPKTKSAPGKTVDLKAVVAPNRMAAAQYYPAQYWYSMMKVPSANLFPGTGPNGNGMSTLMTDQGLWLQRMKTEACINCHQLGDKATRTIPMELGHFDSGAAAWERRLQSGQVSSNMMGEIGRFDTKRQLTLLGDWTDRVAKGELPSSDPSRPAGRERDIVVTEWDWNTPEAYLHDVVATNKRKPTANAHGLIFGATEESSDSMPWLDPADNTTGFVKTEWRDSKTPTTKNKPIYGASAYWGEQRIWDSHTVTHSMAYDEQGRVWLTSRIRPQQDPAWCKAGSDQPSATVFPRDISDRQVEVYDPKTHKVDMIDLCFGTQHLNFDQNNILWFSTGIGTDSVIGWLDVNKWDKTHDERASQGWSPFIIDTSGNGKRDAGWTEPGKPIQPSEDARLAIGIYAVSANPVDGSIWGTVRGFPGGIVRYDPKTMLSEYFEVPYKNQHTKQWGFGPRGADIDGNGVVWVVLASSDVASFDRRLCKQKLVGPALADPKNLCPEGWKIYHLPGPTFEGLPADTTGATVEAPYYDWVDQYDTLGLGKNVPIVTGNESDSLMALVGGKLLMMRVPYPIGFYAKNLDGRIDDPNGGWKGRGLWSSYSERAPTHIEGGKGETSKVVHFQIRPNPLAD